MTRTTDTPAPAAPCNHRRRRVNPEAIDSTRGSHTACPGHPRTSRGRRNDEGAAGSVACPLSPHHVARLCRRDALGALERYTADFPTERIRRPMPEREPPSKADEFLANFHGPSSEISGELRRLATMGLMARNRVAPTADEVNAELDRTREDARTRVALHHLQPEG